MEAEYTRLNKLAEELNLDKELLQDIIQKKTLRRAHRLELAYRIVDTYRCNTCRAVA